MKQNIYAEVISVGTELLLGEITDTNSVFISEQLKNLGIFIHRKSIVGDNISRIKDEIELAFSRSDIVILGGGLGPTEDDLTREAIADFAGKKPYVDSKLLDVLKLKFATFNKTMSSTNIKQAWLIDGAIAIENSIGTAPGWILEKDGKLVIAMPGPPHEMKKMWADSIVNHLPKMPPISHTTLHSSGIGESDIAELLSEFTSNQNPSVATYAREAGVDIRIAASDFDVNRADELVASTSEKVIGILGANVYGRDDETLSGKIVDILANNGHKFSCLESVTGGKLMSIVSETPGLSKCFTGGAVSYSNDIKIKFGVEKKIIEKFGAVSEQTVAEMAQSAKTYFGAEWGIATTGIAGPVSIENKKVGLAYFAVCNPMGKTVVIKMNRVTERKVFQRYVVNALLFSFYKEIRLFYNIT